MMILIKDLGKRLPSKNSKIKRRYGLFQCPICGDIKERIFYHKATKCKKCENVERQTHNLSDHPAYNIWKSMKQRCYNEKNPQYENYGQRGIFVCQEWKDSFENFYNWAMSNNYKSDLSIDRIDNNKGYSPDNCRFATRSIQSRNTRILYRHNSSGYRGVKQFKENGKNQFLARIKIDGNDLHLGVFKTAKQAALARDNFVKINNLEHTLNFKE